MTNKKPLEQKNLIIYPYKVSSLACACGYNQVSVYPAFNQIKSLQCGKCLRIGKMQIKD